MKLLKFKRSFSFLGTPESTNSNILPTVTLTKSQFTNNSKRFSWAPVLRFYEDKDANQCYNCTKQKTFQRIQVTPTEEGTNCSMLVRVPSASKWGKKCFFNYCYLFIFLLMVLLVGGNIKTATSSQVVAKAWNGYENLIKNWLSHETFR